MRFILILCLLLLATPVQAAVDIKNMKAGLCMDPSPDAKADGWVCHETADIQVTDQGRCVYDGKTRHCTWVGIAFDYVADTGRTVLQCVSESSRPTSHGNPRGVVAENTRSNAFELPLEGRQGHFFNPMYYLFAVRAMDDSVLVDTMTCSHEGKVVFRNTFNVHFPTAPEGAP
jgi:hypothetical protein